MECLGVCLADADVAVVEMQFGERSRPFGALARRVEHQLGVVDGDDGRAEALDDAQRELGAPAAEIEHARCAVERQEIEHLFDLRRRDRIAVVVIAVRDAAEFLVIHGESCSPSRSFHGATRRRSAMPGNASAAQIR